MDKRRKRWTAVAVVALTVVLGASGCQSIIARDSEAREGTDTAIVERGALLVTVDAAGNLVPRAEVSVSFSSSGRVAEVFVEEGQTVEAGEPLARLETDDLELQVARAEAALAAASAQLAQLIAPPRPEEIAAQQANLAAAGAQVAAAAANRDQLAAGADEGQVAGAEAQVASVVVQRESAYDMHERTMMCKNFTLPDGEKRTICPALGAPEEQARYNLALADAELASAHAALDELTAGPDVEQYRAAQANVASAEAQRDAAQAQLDLLMAGAAEEDIAVTQTTVDDARLALEQARLELKRAVLAAPIAGTVMSLDLRVGEIVNANQPVIVLGDLAALEVTVNLDEAGVARVTEGMAAEVRADALSDVVLSGQVIDVALKAEDPSGVVLFPVTVSLSESDARLRPGMTAEVEILVAGHNDALIVPLRAVHSEGESVYVERVVGGQTQRVPVTLGLVTETEAEIVDGLNEGDLVQLVSLPVEQTTGPQMGQGNEGIRRIFGR